MPSKKHNYKETITYVFLGLLLGAIYAFIDFYLKLGTENEHDFFSLFLRAGTGGILFFITIKYSRQFLNSKLNKTKFLPALLVKSIVYTLLMLLVLFLINTFWFLQNTEKAYGLQLYDYYTSRIFVLNITSIFLGMLLIIAITQISSLHRKNDLLNFVLGRFNTPLEVERVFCFVDLKGSTSIAEILGHLKYAEFIKDYFADIAEAVQNANAQIYQYVGDEIVLTWSYSKAVKSNACINCVFEMKEIIQQKKDRYKKRYGFVPYFRASIHGGQVVVSWVGRERKEIVYIGDVVNTTSRIQAECKRLGKDFLISGDILDRLNEANAHFMEEIIPKGKAKKVKLYSLDLDR